MVISVSLLNLVWLMLSNKASNVASDRPVLEECRFV